MNSSIILIAPPLEKTGVKHFGALDSELLYLGQLFFNKGVAVNILDCYANPDCSWESMICNHDCDVVIFHLWRTEFIEGGNMLGLIDAIIRIKQCKSNIKIAAFGSMATSLRALLPKEAIDWVNGDVLPSTPSEFSNACQIISDYQSLEVSISEEFLESQNWSYRPSTIVTLRSSRGCNQKCSFCAYNRDAGLWKPRPMHQMVSEMNLFNVKYGSTRFALSDSNFGNKEELVNSRLHELSTLLGETGSGYEISINISFEGLSERVIGMLGKARISTILVGAEALNVATLREIYDKAGNPEYLELLVHKMEEVGISPVLSMILFHPWLTFEQLREEVRRIENFGRHRFVHYFANSYVRMVPGTKIFNRALQDNLIKTDAVDPYAFSFRFSDNRVSAVFDVLQSLFKSKFNEGLSTRQRSKLKILEWEALKHLVEI